MVDGLIKEIAKSGYFLIKKIYKESFSGLGVASVTKHYKEVVNIPHNGKKYNVTFNINLADSINIEGYFTPENNSIVFNWDIDGNTIIIDDDVRDIWKKTRKTYLQSIVHECWHVLQDMESPLTFDDTFLNDMMHEMKCNLTDVLYLFSDVEIDARINSFIGKSRGDLYKHSDYKIFAACSVDYVKNDFINIDSLLDTGEYSWVDLGHWLTNNRINCRDLFCKNVLKAFKISTDKENFKRNIYDLAIQPQAEKARSMMFKKMLKNAGNKI